MSQYDDAVTLTLQGVDAAPPDPANAARFGVQQAASTNPDLHAELQRISQATGVPISSTIANPEEVKRQAKLGAIDFDGLAVAAPSTARLLANIEKAKVSHDDVPNLTAIEKSFRSAQAQGRAVQGRVGEPFRRPGDRRTSGGLVGEQFIRRGELSADEGSYVGGLFNADQFRAQSAGLSIQAADALGLDPTRAIREYQTFRSRAQAAQPDIESPTGKAIYGGLQSVIANAPGLAASMLTLNPAPALAWAGLQSEAEAYGKYRSRGGTPLESGIGAVGEGAVEVATEMIPMGFMVSKLGRARMGEFLTGALAREMPTEQVATFVQDAIDTAVANPKKTWGEFWAERPGAAYQTVVSTLTQSGVMAGIGAALRHTLMSEDADAYDAARAADAQRKMQQMIQLAGASKVRERDASTFEGFMQDATADGPQERVWINPKDLQAAGIDLTQLAAVAPGTAPQIAQALETGQDVAIQTSELLTRLPGTELEQSLVEHLKTDPGGFSAAGAKNYMQTEHAEVQRREVEKVLAENMADSSFKASRLAVHDNVLQQLQAANRFTDDVNGPYAAMWADFFAVQAARLKVMPEDLFNQFGPRIVAESPAGASLDQTLSLKDNPAFREWFGESKVVDPQGAPQVVYHGTADDFTAFSGEDGGKNVRTPASRQGFYFTDRPDIAERYSQMREGTQQVMPVYLSMQNPVRATFSNMKEADDFLAKGYDGDGAIITVNTPAPGITRSGFLTQTVYAVKNPTQIKSATGNRGTFDPNDPNILRQDATNAAQLAALDKREAMLQKLLECVG